MKLVWEGGGWGSLRLEVEGLLVGCVNAFSCKTITPDIINYIDTKRNVHKGCLVWEMGGSPLVGEFPRTLGPSCGGVWAASLPLSPARLSGVLGLTTCLVALQAKVRGIAWLQLPWRAGT